MSKSEKFDMDQLIRESMEGKLNECPTPSLSKNEAWEKMKIERSGTRNPLTKNRFPKRALLAVASIFLVLVIASYPQQGSAFSRWSEMFSKAQGTVVQLFGSSERPVTAVEGEKDTSNGSDYEVIEGAGTISEQLSLEEAGRVTNFPIIVPVTPAEFELDQVTVLREEGKTSDEIILNYVGDEKGFVITEKALVGNYGFGATMDSDDTKVDEVFINGQQAFLTTYKNGVCSLTWMTQAHYIQIEGKLTKEEIMAIAGSM